MKLVGLMTARNEDWVIGASARAALAWCDALVVLCHACVDNTREIVEQIASENPGRVSILIDNSGTWTEMSHRQATLTEARRIGATHCAVVDCDEILCGDTVPFIRDRISLLRPGTFLGIPMRNLHRSLDRFRSDGGVWGARAGTMIAFADAPALCWQMTNGYDHHHRSPHGSRTAGRIENGGGVMHLQFASWRRLVAKHNLYRFTERVRWPDKPISEINKLYGLAVDETGAETMLAPKQWWSPWQELRPMIHVDSEPWQEEECRRMLRHYGAETFAGVDYHGVPK